MSYFNEDDFANGQKIMDILHDMIIDCPDDELDELLVEAGMDPGEAAQQGREAVWKALISTGHKVSLSDVQSAAFKKWFATFEAAQKAGLNSTLRYGNQTEQGEP